MIKKVSKIIYLVFLCGYSGVVFSGEEIIPDGNQQLAWKQYLESITASSVGRCMPYGKQYFVYDYLPEKDQFSTESVFEVSNYLPDIS